MKLNTVENIAITREELIIKLKELKTEYWWLARLSRKTKIADYMLSKYMNWDKVMSVNILEKLIEYFELS